MALHELRTAVWHLRTGGINQVKEWVRRNRAGANNPKGRKRGAYEYHPVVPLERAPSFPHIRAGVILDDFSRAAFAPEWDQVVLTRNWETQLDDGLDLLFVESAWNGNSGQWKYQLTGTSGVKEDFTQLLAACNQRKIPTVFWNKEDPPHFEDFIEAAALFDYVFTSDINMVPAYRERLGHPRVWPLSFAAQPSIHNPVRAAGPREEDGVAFAGMYFAHKFPERRAQMEWLLPAAGQAAEKTQERFAIFSRQLGNDDRYQFPPPLNSAVVGSLPYDEMLAAYKDFKVFLNVNSVVDSPSMCARRIFELTASGTAVVSSPSQATAAFFPSDEVFQPADSTAAYHTVRALLRSQELRDRAVHVAARRVWGAHTYAHRIAEVVSHIGLPGSPGLGEGAGSVPGQGSVSVLASTNRPHQLAHLFAQVGQQTVAPELVLVSHGFSPKPSELDGLCEEHGIDNLVHIDAGHDLTLGECLNLSIDAASGTIVAKFDDDDLYGAHYLEDARHALMYSGAQLVGKNAHYMHIESHNATVLRFPEREHKFTNLVMGPTMVGSRETFNLIRFSRKTIGEDTDFQERLLDESGRIYSADRFNFVQMRKRSHVHTWDIDSAELLGAGVLHSYGLPAEHYFF